jgi:hypothetical protein
MKAVFISVSLLIVAMFIVPVGGMCEANENANFYMYGFLGCEILCVASLTRAFFKSRRN